MDQVTGRGSQITRGVFMDLVPGLIEEIEKRFGKLAANVFIISILGSALLAFLGFTFDMIIQLETMLNNLPKLLGRFISTFILVFLAWLVLKIMANRIIKRLDETVEKGKLEIEEYSQKFEERKQKLEKREQKLEKSIQKEKELLDKMENMQEDQINAFRQFTADLGDHEMPTPELEDIRKRLKEKYPPIE